MPNAFVCTTLETSPYKTGRNVSPGHTNLLVTRLPAVTARQVVWLYPLRWRIELMHRNLKSDLELCLKVVYGGNGGVSQVSCEVTSFV